MDPQITEDGRPYGPIRFHEIAKECYLITKSLNTSYRDVLSTTPTERKCLLGFLIEDAKQREQMLQLKKAEAAANK